MKTSINSLRTVNPFKTMNLLKNINLFKTISSFKNINTLGRIMPKLLFVLLLLFFSSILFVEHSVFAENHLVSPPEINTDETIMVGMDYTGTLTAGQRAMLPEVFSGSLILEEGSTVLGQAYQISGQGSIDSDGLDMTKGHVQLFENSIPISAASDMTIHSGSSSMDSYIEGTCAEGCQINGVPLTSGTTFKFNPETNHLEGSCSASCCSGSCNVASWQVSEGMSFDYNQLTDDFSAVCNPPCSINGVSIPSHGELDQQLHDDPELLRRYLGRNPDEIVPEDEDLKPTYPGPITLEFKKKEDSDIWEMYVIPAERDIPEPLHFNLEQFRATGMSIKIITEGKVPVTFDNGDSYTAESAGYNGVIIYAPESAKDKSEKIEIGQGIRYNRDGMELSSVAPTFLCSENSYCQREEGKSVVLFDESKRRVYLESDLHPLEVDFKEGSMFDQGEGNPLKIKCKEFCKAELLDRSIAVKDAAETATAEKVVPAKTLGDVPEDDTEPVPLGIRQTGGTLVIDNGGQVIDSSNNQFYLLTGSSQQEVQGPPKPLTAYELVVIDVKEDGAESINRKGYGTINGGFVIDDRAVLTDLLVPLDSDLVDFQGVDRPVLAYQAANDFHAFCKELGGIGGRCKVRDVGRTYQDQLERFRASPKTAVKPENIGYHQLFAAVDMDELDLGIKLNNQQRGEISSADGVLSPELLRRLPAKGAYSYSTYVKIKDNPARAINFEKNAIRLNAMRQKWGSVAKKHNFNFEYVSIGCGGNSLCPYEGWHIVHGPSIRSARNVIGGKEEYVRALHPLQAPAEVKFPTVEVAGEMDVVPPG